MAGEINTGTDTTRAVSPDALAGSYAGTAVISLPLTNYRPMPWWSVMAEPSSWSGRHERHESGLRRHGRAAAGSGARLTTIQIRRCAGGNADILFDPDHPRFRRHQRSRAVINTDNDNLVTDDLIYIDIHTVKHYPPQGGMVALEARLP